MIILDQTKTRMFNWDSVVEVFLLEEGIYLQIKDNRSVLIGTYETAKEAESVFSVLFEKISGECKSFSMPE